MMIGLGPWRKQGALEKMRDLIMNNKDLFSSLFTYVFSENRTYEDVKTFFFCFSNQCDQITYWASHCLSPALTRLHAIFVA